MGVDVRKEESAYSHVFRIKHVFTRAGVRGKKRVHVLTRIHDECMYLRGPGCGERRECMFSQVFTMNACIYEGRGVGEEESACFHTYSR
jgi:hypothetical protein